MFSYTSDLFWYSFLIVFDLKKLSFFENLADVIRDVRVDDIMICDDFNCVLDNGADIISGKKHAERTVVKFNTILN